MIGRRWGDFLEDAKEAYRSLIAYLGYMGEGRDLSQQRLKGQT